MNSRVTSYALGLLLLLLSAGGGVAHATTPAFTNCKSNPALTFTTISFSPYPPSKRYPLTWSAELNASESITVTSGAAMVLTYKVSSVLVARETTDLCSLFGLTAGHCTIPAGHHAILYTHSLPDSVPPFVTVDVHLVFNNGDGSVLACLDTKMKFMP